MTLTKERYDEGQYSLRATNISNELQYFLLNCMQLTRQGLLSKQVYNARVYASSIDELAIRLAAFCKFDDSVLLLKEFCSRKKLFCSVFEKYGCVYVFCSPERADITEWKDELKSLIV